MTRSTRVHKVYDIYNNARGLGGKFRMTIDQYLMINSEGFSFLTESKKIKKSKYQNRAEMDDITLRIGAVVIIDR